MCEWREATGLRLKAAGFLSEQLKFHHQCFYAAVSFSHFILFHLSLKQFHFFTFDFLLLTSQSFSHPHIRTSAHLHIRTSAHLHPARAGHIRTSILPVP
jgi:hypothetical protein